MIKNKKMINKNFRKYFTIFLIAALLLFVSGQEGCSTSLNQLFPGNADSGKTGLDYSLISGTDMLTQGKLLVQGESFYVGIHIENYDLNPKNGQICIKDNIADNYDGISNQGEGECVPFNIKAAEIVKVQGTGLSKKESEEIKPATADVYFPTNSEYSYNNLPSLLKPYEASLQVSLRYVERSQATSTLSFQTEQASVTLSQEPTPIIISATKSLHKRQDGYVLNMDILLKKQASARIFSPDFSVENTTYFSAELSPEKISCSTSSGEAILDKLLIENERLIKCSTIIYSTGEITQSYPLVITLDYGVALEKQYNFGVKTSEEI